MFFEICMQIYPVVFALSRQINNQKVCENNKQLISFAQVIKFCKISSSRGGLTPTPLCVRPCAHGSISERDLCRTKITTQHNSLNTRIKTPLAGAIRYLIYKDISFVRHKVICALPNATAFCIVVVLITLKTILNEKVGYHFCQVILLFWLRQKVVP